jgi:Protein of unknown function (DUF4446)
MIPLTPITVSLIAAHFVTIIVCIYLIMRVSKLTKGADGRSLEDKIQSILTQNVTYGQHFTKVDSRLAKIEDRMRRVVRNVKTNRFDPFEGAGSSGKQSFAVALLDDDGNGAVISSLHTHDKVRVFAKPILNFSSTHELSDEEKKVIADAS